MKPRSVLWTPNGPVDLENTKKPDRVELRPGIMEWFRQASDVFTSLKIGMHCSICKADIVGKNADTDKVFSFSCGCRDFIGGNRDYREPPKARTH